MNSKMIIFDYMIRHLKIKWFLILMKQNSLVLFEKARCKGTTNITLRGRRRFIHLRTGQRSLYLFCFNTLLDPLIKKKVHDAYGHFINLKRSLPKLISSQQKSLAYQTYNQSFLVYGSQIWFPTKTNIEKLEKFQRSVTRWMSRETFIKVV